MILKQRLFLRGIIPSCLSLLISASHAIPIKKITSDKSSEKIRNMRPVLRVGNDFKSHSIGLGLGQTFLQGDFKDNGHDSITWDLLYNYSASYSYDMMMAFHLSSHRNLSNKARLLGLSIGIKAKFFQFDSFAPFLMGGLGFYSPTVTRRLSGGSVDQTDARIVFGTHLAAGTELELTPSITIGLMGHLHNPFDIQQDQGPDIEGSYFKLLVTGLYSFQ